MYINDYNSFIYHFVENDEIINKKRKLIPKNKNSIQHYIKNANVSIPSNDRLKKESFLDDFYKNYNNSFANFCGISEKIYKEIYQKTQFIPEINQMGDIIINITKIIKYLDTFSDSKQLKIHRRLKKIHKIPPKDQKKFLNINNNKTNNISNDIPLDEDDIEGKVINKIILKEKTNLSHSNSNNESDINYKDNKQNDDALLNIKRKLKNISISKPNNDLFDTKIKSKIFNLSANSIEDKIFNFKNDTNDLNKDINKEIFPLSNDFQYKSSQPNQLDFKFGENSNKNNIFNFSVNEIHDLSNNSQKNNINIFTPLMNKEEANNNLILSPDKALFSPYNFSSIKFNSLLSPNLSLNSPYNANGINYPFNFRNNEFNDSIEENNNVIYNANEKKDNANDNGSIVDNENIKKEKKEK
jgi:hypothetical protein